MKIGISTFAIDLTDLAELGRRAEDAGIESLWMSDHLVVPAGFEAPYPYTPDGAAPFPEDQALFDPWVALAVVATATSTIRLGTWVYVIGARHHLVTARAVATVDLLSGGRAILGAGAGWLREEFAAAGLPWERRGARMEEVVEALRLLYSPGPAEYHGEHVDMPAVQFEPKPPQGARLPIQLGGETDVAMRRAVRIADGWLGMQADSGAARERVEKIQRLQAECGRSGAFETTVGATTALDKKVYDAYAATGVDRIIVSPWYSGTDWRAAIDAIGGVLSAVA